MRLWHASTGQPAGVPLPVVDTGYTPRAIAFSPDGSQLATAGTDGAVRLWDVWPLTHPYEALCADAGAPTSQEWAQYAAGEPQPRVCA
jgi:WD40 repeat protein